jgi:hypothetical protein
MVRAPGAVVEGPARPEQHRQCDERDRSQRRREDDQYRHGEHDLQPAADHLDQRLAQELVERLDVGGEPRDEHAGPLLLEEAERQRLQLGERALTQRRQEPLRRRRGRQRLHADDERLHEGESKDRERRHVDRVLLVLHDAVVDGVADERRPRERDQRRDDHRGGGDEVEPLDGPGQRPRLAPHLACRSSLVHAALISSASSSR